MHEIETRIIDINVDDIRNKLKNLNASKVKEESQVNNIFDFSDRRMLNAKGYARIREVFDHISNRNIYYMTTKKLLSQEKYKIMDECEVEISNGDEGKKIFNSLGLELVESIKKFRESYQYKNTLIEIDINDPSFCPFPYIEIESLYEDEIIEVVGLLGYTMNDTTSKTIYEILKDKSSLKGL
ncbi:class IV adenylate cyclase [Clostridium ihumii]|uniref:class IV adenylate cyclase n=1 Tax=Clostridium ihumii TaxID=1470356 RepID=UPI000556F110|nr:CYTH domain-containing protein [Clostridium ihumii]